MKELAGGFRGACERGDSRLVHFSIQRDHLHLLLEAADEGALGLGRYHSARAAHAARSALAYVLLNARKHWAQRTSAPPPVQIDEASSGAWFAGWSRMLQPISSREPPVAPPRTWLLRVGWRRHGLIDPAEVPGLR